MYRAINETSFNTILLDDSPRSSPNPFYRFDIDENIFMPATSRTSLLSRARGLTRNQKIALSALAVVVLGGTLIGLLSYFLSDKTLPIIPTVTPSIGPSPTTPWTTITTSTASTTTPFMTTTTAPTTTGTTADPRCALDLECCDAGQWICG